MSARFVRILESPGFRRGEYVKDYNFIYIDSRLEIGGFSYALKAVRVWQKVKDIIGK